MAHAFIHSPDHDYVRCIRGQRNESECGEAKCEGDRHGGKNHRADEPYEEDQQVEVSQRPQHGGEQCQHSDNRDDQRQGGCDMPEVTDGRQPKYGDQNHQSDADRKRSGAPCVHNLKRRSRDVNLIGCEFDGRVDYQRRNASAAATAITSRKALAAGSSMPMTAVIRMCSPR
jgi:hypothetical protein